MKIVVAFLSIIIIIPLIIGSMIIGYVLSYWVEKIIDGVKEKLYGGENSTIEECSKKEIPWFLMNVHLHTVDTRLDPIEKIIYNLVPGRYVDAHIKIINTLFSGGYCWHFAHMLKNSFNRGEICWAIPFSHFVWKDEDGVYWDINGKVNENECSFFIPESYIPDDIMFIFKHTNYAGHDIKEFNIEDYMGVVDAYAKDNNFTYDREYVKNLIGRSMIDREHIPCDTTIKYNTRIERNGD